MKISANKSPREIYLDGFRDATKRAISIAENIVTPFTKEKTVTGKFIAEAIKKEAEKEVEGG